MQIRSSIQETTCKPYGNLKINIPWETGPIRPRDWFTYMLGFLFWFCDRWVKGRWLTMQMQENSWIHENPHRVWTSGSPASGVLLHCRFSRLPCLKLPMLWLRSLFYFEDDCWCHSVKQKVGWFLDFFFVTKKIHHGIDSVHVSPKRHLNPKQYLRMVPAPCSVCIKLHQAGIKTCSKEISWKKLNDILKFAWTKCPRKSKDCFSTEFSLSDHCICV